MTIRSYLTFPRITTALVLVQSFILLHLPLTNVLGLEFALGSVPLVSLIAGLATIRYLRVARDEQPYADYPSRGSLARFLIGLGALPAVLGALNMVFVRNCAPLDGFFYYVLVVAGGMGFSVSLAYASRSILPTSPHALFLTGWIITLVHGPLVTFVSPQIFFYDPIFGYFPGFSYDQSLSALPGLAVYRISTIVLMLTLWGTGRLVVRYRATGYRGMTSGMAAVIAGWVLLAGWNLQSDAMGFSTSMSSMRHALGGMKTTAHIVLVYPKDQIDDATAERLAEAHEFQYMRLVKTLQVAPVKPVVSVVFASAEQKNRYVGGGSTQFTKPWLWQMYLTLDDAPQVMKHEMVHILAAEFGFPLIRVGINSGLIEGLAVALERESYGMSLMRAAAAIRYATGHADIDGVFSMSGFFQANSSVSYSLAGSFCRFLIEKYGMRRFKHLYRTGSYRSYGKSFEALRSEWEHRVEQVGLTRSDSLKAAYLFRRPVQFSEECYHFKGTLIQEARTALATGNDSTAVALADKVLASSSSIAAESIKARGLIRLGRYHDAITALRPNGVPVPREDVGRRYLEGDALWGLDSLHAAIDAYSDVCDVDLSDGWNEAAALRREMIRVYGSDQGVRALMIAGMPDTIRSEKFRDLALVRPEPLIRFALARTLSPEKDGRSIISLLTDVSFRNSPRIDYALRLRRAHAYLWLKEYTKARINLWESQNDISDDVRFMDIAEQLDWVDWLEARGL